MTGSFILSKQNESLQVKSLAAQRQLYSEEKSLVGLQFWLAFCSSFAILIWRTIDPSASTSAVSVAVVITLLDCFVIQHFRGKRRKLAAKIQEKFDCDVLNLAWNHDLAGDEPQQELIIEAASKTPKEKGSLFKNWYLGRLNMVPLEVARIICQTTNVTYDQSLRKRYLKILMWLIITIFLSTILVCAVHKIPTDLWLANFIGTLIPIISFSVIQYREHSDVNLKTVELRNELQGAWRHCNDNSWTKDELDKVSRKIQNKIFSHRASGTPLLDEIYWLYRDKQELHGEELANQMVDEYLKDKTKK